MGMSWPSLHPETCGAVRPDYYLFSHDITIFSTRFILASAGNFGKLGWFSSRKVCIPEVNKTTALMHSAMWISMTATMKPETSCKNGGIDGNQNCSASKAPYARLLGLTAKCGIDSLCSLITFSSSDSYQDIAYRSCRCQFIRQKHWGWSLLLHSSSPSSHSRVQRVDQNSHPHCPRSLLITVLL